PLGREAPALDQADVDARPDELPRQNNSRRARPDNAKIGLDDAAVRYAPSIDEHGLCNLRSALSEGRASFTFRPFGSIACPDALSKTSVFLPFEVALSLAAPPRVRGGAAIASNGTEQRRR